MLLPPPRLDWRRTVVPTRGCEAQIQEMVLCCGSTACAQPLCMLCAQHWSYPLFSLGKRVSVTVGDTSSGLPDTVSSHLMCRRLPLPLAGHRAVPQAVSRAQHLQHPSWFCLHGRLGR